jgi:hypothetical protein
MPHAELQPHDPHDPRWRMDGIEGVALGEGRTLLRDIENGAELSVQNGRLARGAGYDTAPSPSRHSLARTGAILRLRQRNRYYVHASGVVSPDGRALVFVGESGSGKSTIAFALARLGWSLLGDDGVVLEPLPSRTIVHGWRSPLLVSASLEAHFPELRRHSGEVIAGDRRARVPMYVEGSSHATLNALVFVQQGGNGSLRPCGESHALMQLIRQSPWVLLGDGFSERHFSALRRIVATARLLSFRHGPAELRRVAELFAGVGGPESLGASACRD